MNKQIDKWVTTFRQHSVMFRNSFGSMNEIELNWKPSESKWSVGQVIDHIIRTNETYFPIFSQLAAGTYSVPAIAHVPFFPKIIGSLLINSLSPDRRTKTTTFPIWKPSSSKIATSIVTDFVEHHEKLISILEQHSSLFQKKIVISSPANKYVVYPLSDAIEIILTHETRHYNQAMEVIFFNQGR